VTEIEAVIEPDGVGNDIWRESVTFVCIHHRITTFQGVKLARVGMVHYVCPELRASRMLE
jgi:hypothetical protein